MNTRHHQSERQVPFNPGQTHVHEVQGSTKLAGAVPHNHRFAAVTSQAIPVGNDHVHGIMTNTDFGIEHLHELGIVTGLSIPVGNGKHVHFASGTTTLNLDHVHEFVFTTLIKDPLDAV